MERKCPQQPRINLATSVETAEKPRRGLRPLDPQEVAVRRFRKSAEVVGYGIAADNMHRPPSRSLTRITCGPKPVQRRDDPSDVDPDAPRRPSLFRRLPRASQTPDLR